MAVESIFNGGNAPEKNFDPLKKIVYKKATLRRWRGYENIPEVIGVNHVIVNLVPKEMSIDDKYSLFGGFITIHYNLSIYFQLSLSYANKVHKEILYTGEQMNKNFEDKFESTFKKNVEEVLSKYNDDTEILDKIDDVEVEVKNRIENNESFRRYDILCLASCELKPSFKEVDLETRGGVISGDFMYEKIYNIFKSRDNKFKNDQLERINEEKRQSYIRNEKAKRKMILAEIQQNIESKDLLIKKIASIGALDESDIVLEKKASEKEQRLKKIQTDKEIFDKSETLRKNIDSIKKQFTLNAEEIALNNSKKDLLKSDSELGKLEAEGKKVISEIEIEIEVLKKKAGNSFELEKLDKILHKLPELAQDQRKIEHLKVFHVQNGEPNHANSGNNILDSTYKLANSIQLLKDLLNFLKD